MNTGALSYCSGELTVAKDLNIGGDLYVRGPLYSSNVVLPTTLESKAVTLANPTPALGDSTGGSGFVLIIW